MKKLTEKQKHQVETARDEASSVLRELKSRPLKGKELARMKLIEDAVATLEVVVLL